jgi:UDP-2,4-diacetamido-2,4,6-trideoxy-beta-L-altropyranose hydrolase
VLDHYSFDHRWQKALQFTKTKILVIDDLADRSHACTILVDQNLGRIADDYQNLVPKSCKTLIGAKYALLRPEFADTRATALRDRAQRPFKEDAGLKILVTMGGVDAVDATSGVLRALARMSLPSETRISIIMGSNAPALVNVRRLAREMPYATTVDVDISQMAEYMAKADLAIGAAGSTSWERCALGLPSVILQIAENQAASAHALHVAGAVIDIGKFSADNSEQPLQKAIETALNNLPAMSQAAAEICCGDGVHRVTSAMLGAKTRFRLATAQDARRIWEWRSQSNPEHYQLGGQKTSYEDHCAWLGSALKEPARHFRILESGSLACGYVRLDKIGASQAQVSICLSSEMRGQGLSHLLLSEASDLAKRLGVTTLTAAIHIENSASQMCFKKAGFEEFSSAGTFRTYVRNWKEN